MMKDVIIKIDQNSMVYKQETVLGISYENLQGKIIFKFLGTFPKGIAYLEYERDTEKGYLQMNQVGEEYQLEIKSSLLTKEGRIYLQLRVTEDATPEGIPVFKSNKFYLEVKEAINATTEIPDEYPEWIDIANEKIKEMDNLNITTERVEDGVDIVLTDKKGNTTRTEVKDGAPGPVGPQGAPGAVKMQVVDTLPETGETDTIYLVKKDNPGEQNLYDEYVYTDTGWEHIGDTSVDLSNYYTKTEVKQITGELTNLNTEDKSSLVNAVNEVFNKPTTTLLENKTIDLNNLDIEYGTYIISGSDTVIKYNHDSEKPLTQHSKCVLLLGKTDFIPSSGYAGSYAIIFINPLSGGFNMKCYNNRGSTTVTFDQIVHKNKNCEIFGLYNFFNKLPTSSLVPTSDNQLVNKKYVDDQVGNINTILATLTTVSEVTK